MADHLARNLIALRTALGKTQDELATAAGLSRNHYRLLETGVAAGRPPANPRLSTLEALALALSVGVEDLVVEPRVRTVFRWAEAETDLEDRQESVVLDRLLVFSARHLGDRAAAFVGHDERTLAMGVALPASSDSSALILIGDLHEQALRRAGVRAVLLDDIEITDGVDGLVGAES